MALGILSCVVACGTALRWDGGYDPDPSGDPELRAYKEEYYRSLGQRFVAHLDDRELLAEIAIARVLYLGDHHDDPALHQRYLELLDAVHTTRERLAIGLEAIGEEDEPAVRDYLAGRIDLLALRERIRARWPGSWLDTADVDHDFYRALLERARAWGAEVFALEPIPRGPLRERDVVIADNVLRAARRHPRALLVVVVGQAHIAGPDRVLASVALPSVAFAARMSMPLRADVEAHPRGAPYLRSESGMLLHHPAR